MSSANLKQNKSSAVQAGETKHKPQKQARLSHSGVSDEKELEKVVTEIVILSGKSFILPPLPHLTLSADGIIIHLIFLLTIRGSLSTWLYLVVFISIKYLKHNQLYIFVQQVYKEN